MKVLKFGGTSVGSPERMKSVAEIIRQEESCIVVLSALAGTTNALVEICEALDKSDKQRAKNILSELSEHYTAFVSQLYATEEKKKQANELVDNHFNHILSFTKDMFTVHEERTILAQGELLSTAMFHYYMEENAWESQLLPSLDFMRITRDNEPDYEYISENIQKQFSEKPSSHYIVQGYICRNAYGDIDNLKRGGSDYTASIIGAVTKAEEIQIWTDIDGMHNNDPRIVDTTYPIRQLTFNEAAELAYFGAKILHPSSIRPAQDANIPVRLKNTMAPEAEGTLISANSEANKIKAVAAKDGITAIKIRSGRMLLAYGFLRSVFEVFERYKTPIDMITTSEVAVSLTVDDETHLIEITTELENFGTVEIDKDLTIICVVGDFLEGKSGYAAKIFNALQEIPIRMVSYGGSKNNVSLLVRSSDKVQALQALNKGVFEIQG